MRLRPRTLRGRITLVLALVTLGLAIVVGVAVDVEYRSSLHSALDESLANRFAAVADEVASAAKSRDVRPGIPDAESFAQVIAPDGAVVAASPRALGKHAVLSGRDLARARTRRVTLQRDAGPRGETSRLLAGPAGTRGDVVVVATTLDETNHAQRRLELALAVALPLLALLVTMLGWFLAGMALKPVQEMIVDADVIAATSARQLSRRLATPPVPEELAQLATHLNHLLERIEAALEHERTFIDDASHELRTPISIARGELELARHTVPDGVETAAALDSALEEIDRLDRLAASLLVLARSRAGAPAPASSVPLRATVQHGVDLAVAAEGDRPHATVVLAGDDDVTVAADAEPLQRAVRNVVENALRYARRRVDVRVSANGASATVEVADDGPGFPPALVDGGLGRFVTPRDVDGHPGGAGLGLAIVEAIVAGYGGEFALSNANGHGAVVRLTLPRGTLAGEPPAGDGRLHRPLTPGSRRWRQGGTA